MLGNLSKLYFVAVRFEPQFQVLTPSVIFSNGGLKYAGFLLAPNPSAWPSPLILKVDTHCTPALKDALPGASTRT